MMMGDDGVIYGIAQATFSNLLVYEKGKRTEDVWKTSRISDTGTVRSETSFNPERTPAQFNVNSAINFLNNVLIYRKRGFLPGYFGLR